MSHIENRIDAVLEILPGINRLTASTLTILGQSGGVDTPGSIVPLNECFGWITADISSTIKSPKDIGRIWIVWISGNRIINRFKVGGFSPQGAVDIAGRIAVNWCNWCGQITGISIIIVNASGGWTSTSQVRQSPRERIGWAGGKGVRVSYPC